MLLFHEVYRHLLLRCVHCYFIHFHGVSILIFCFIIWFVDRKRNFIFLYIIFSSLVIAFRFLTIRNKLLVNNRCVISFIFILVFLIFITNMSLTIIYSLYLGKSSKNVMNFFSKFLIVFTSQANKSKIKKRPF